MKHLIPLLLILALPLLAEDAAPTHPPIVDPGQPGTPEKVGSAPSDSVVLFDGKSFDHWEGTRGGDKTVKWKLVGDGSMEAVKGGGSIKTRERYGYGQYHVGFRTPEVVRGNSQGRGNSGVFPMGKAEVQVLDSYDNITYRDGQCGAIYKRHVPIVNACRKPGVWQTYDIIVHPPLLDSGGKKLRNGSYTVLHNGVLIHAYAEVNANNANDKGQLSLQDHGNPVRYRNIWYRPWTEPLPRPVKK